MSIVSIYNIDEYVIKQTIDFPDGLVTVGQLLEIDQSDLSSEFAKHSPRLAWVNMLAANAKAAYEEAKANVKTIYANVDAEVRQTGLANFSKMTEKAIEAEVVTDPDYMEAKHKEIETGRQAEMLSGIARALYQRGELLQSLGALHRQERQFEDLSMKIKPYQDRTEE